MVTAAGPATLDYREVKAELDWEMAVGTEAAVAS